MAANGAVTCAPCSLAVGTGCVARKCVRPVGPEPAPCALCPGSLWKGVHVSHTFVNLFFQPHKWENGVFTALVSHFFSF